VLLDPCAGIGTIPMETMFLPKFSRHQPALALGGDLVLGPCGMASLATTYEKAARRVAADLASGKTITAENLLAWDASHLPIRSGSVDVIVSDLPFGHSCLSSKKLSQLLPVLMSELARVLRPGLGRMVLLCGYYLPILEELRRTNESSAYTIINASNTNDTFAKRTHIAATTATSALLPIWTLPCQAVFPVNIGGHLAWVIQVRRGMGTARSISRQVERVRKMAHTRERNDQCRAMDDNNKMNMLSKKGRKNFFQS
jgi:SAM-dependent methyltransferase